MTSAAIVTLVGNSNYGNRLQNFALQEALLNLGVGRVETISSSQQENDFNGSFCLRGLTALQTKRPREIAMRLYKRISPLHANVTNSASVTEITRKACIETFTQTYITQTARDYLQDEIDHRLAASFDYFVVGSDQVWTPTASLSNRLRFLEFSLAHQRVAYAASFGLSNLPIQYRRSYRSSISRIAHVSVREDRAAEMVRELTGRQVPVVLDPTMLLDRTVWETLAVIPATLAEGGYMAEFFLGSPTRAQLLPAIQHATAHDLDIVNLSWGLPSTQSTRLSGSRRFDDLATMGPLEFIGAIKASSLLVTDSFHAAVFATIFRVPFLLKGRGAMNSRFDTLLRKSGLTMPKWGTRRELEASIDIDWESVRTNIARERAESLAYLRFALSPSSGT